MCINYICHLLWHKPTLQFYLHMYTTREKEKKKGEKGKKKEKKSKEKGKEK